MKKSFLLFVLLLVSTVSSFAQSVIIDGISYSISGSRASVARGIYVGDIVIPEKINYLNKEYTVTGIDDYAFSSCYNLTSVTLSDSIVTIGSCAFHFCSSLNSIRIPNNVSLIKTNPFLGCSNLTSIVVESGNTTFDSRNNCNAIIRTSSNTLICGCKNTVIPNSVTRIDYYAFSGCTGLTSVTIPNSVTTIMDYAFSNCSALESIRISSSVRTITYGTFDGCTSLKSVDIPNSVTTIMDGAFSNCSALESIRFPSSVNYISLSSFYGCIGLKSIVVDNGNKHYDSRDNCNAIIETESNTLYYGCQNTIIPNGIKTIGEYAFRGITGLKSISIPNSVLSIGERAFVDCTSLKSVDIPNSVTTIGLYAFNNCSALESIRIPSSVIKIVDLSSFVGCIGLKSIVVDNGNKHYDSRDNCNAIIETETNQLVTGCKNTIIPNNVTIIGRNSFLNISDLKSISIPYSVTIIEDGAFYGCRLESIRASNPYVSYKGFSLATQNHAVVYIPVGTWESFVYDGDWGGFNNLKETAVAQQEISSASAYTLMNAKDYSYAVYDAINDRVAIMPSHGSVDESNAYHSWQLVKSDNGYSIYNLGARKYLKINSDGSMALQTSPVTINMVDRGNGIELGADKDGRWNFVLNNSMYADTNLAGIDATVIDNDDAPSTYYSLDGQKIAQPRKGMNIIKSANGQTRKVILK